MTSHRGTRTKRQPETVAFLFQLDDKTRGRGFRTVTLSLGTGIIFYARSWASLFLQGSSASMMSVCPRCERQNPPGVAVCIHCATPLANLCPNCGFENPSGFKFCGNCGTNLLTAALARSGPEMAPPFQGQMPSHLVDKILTVRQHIEGERRTVTTLFADVVGFTSVAEKLDPETVYTIIEACVAAFCTEIYAHEGTLDKFMGDGVMALFGAPVAHEDDPARAIRCALGMQAALARINQTLVQQHGMTLQMRIGLSLGTVVVGNIGADLRMNYTALGDAVNIAARLQSMAEPGAILCSRAVYEETRAFFEFRELGAIRLKGRVEPVEIYEVVGAKREPGRTRGLPGVRAPMVGREQELARLQALVDDLVRHERGGVVLVTGEAGLGKTRLIEELGLRLAREEAYHGVRVCKGSCSAYGQPAYGVVIQLLDSFFEIQPEDTADARRTRVESRTRQILGDEGAIMDILPYLEHLMGIEPLERELAERIRHLEPAPLRRQTLLAIRDLFVRASSQTPLLLILEDLHWVDRPSLDLLLFLLAAAEHARILCLCLARPTANQAVPQLQRVGAAALGAQFTHLALSPLSFEDSVALVDLLLALSDFPEPLRELIPQRAEGNPFYIEEIIRMLIDHGIIQHRAERWELAPGADLYSFQVPRTLEGLIMARVDNLPESTRYVAQCAAVIGRDFAEAILRQITNDHTPRLDSDLQELVEHELVRQIAAQPEPQYTFRHILTQQTIYNSVLQRRRKQLHHKIGIAIETLYPDRLDDQAEQLAFHFSESEDAARALPYVIRAAERAAARFANEEALAYYRHALDLARRAQAASREQIRILSGLGDAQTFVGDFEGATASLRAAWDLARAAPISALQMRQTADLARRLGRVYERRAKYDEAMQWLDQALRQINQDATSDKAVERVRIYLDIGWVHYRRGNLEQAEEWRLRALEIAEGLDYYAEIGSAYNGLAALYHLKGDWRRAIEFAQRGLQIRERIGDVEGIGRSHSNLGAILMNVGDWERALTHLQQSLAVKQRIGDAKFLASAYHNLGYYYLYKGDLAQAREFLEMAQRQAEKIEDVNLMCLALNALAQVDIQEGNYDLAQERLAASIHRATETGAREALGEAHWILGQAELGRGDLERARQVAQRAVELGREAGMRQVEASALRVLGAVERQAYNWNDAESYLAQSLTIFDELENPFEKARSELELGLLLLARGKPGAARAALEQSRDIFARLGAADWFRRAEQAVRALGT